MKRKTITIITILLFGLATIGLWKLNKDFLMIWNANNLSVTTDTPLTKDKVKIEYGVSVNTINRKNDLDLFADRSKYITLYDGQPKSRMINEYGENDFLITYDNKYYLSFRQFKFSRRHQHDYNFHFFTKDSKVYVNASINGQDQMKFERALLEISSASNYRANVPVDSAGTIYNMIELVNPDK